jgi:hypothetical protein
MLGPTIIRLIPIKYGVWFSCLYKTPSDSLPKGCRAPKIKKDFDEQRLIDVTHAHLAFDKFY